MKNSIAMNLDEYERILNEAINIVMKYYKNGIKVIKGFEREIVRSEIKEKIWLLTVSKSNERIYL